MTKAGKAIWDYYCAFAVILAIKHFIKSILKLYDQQVVSGGIFPRTV